MILPPLSLPAVPNDMYLPNPLHHVQLENMVIPPSPIKYKYYNYDNYKVL